MPDPTDVQVMTDAAQGGDQVEDMRLWWLAEINYVAYFNHADGRSLISGAPLPTWDQQSGPIREAWKAGARAVRDSVIGSR